MKRTLGLILCIAVAMTTLFGAGQKEAAADKVYTLKLGHASTTESTRHKALLVMKEYVEKESNGRLIIEIYPAETRQQNAMIEAMKLGTLEMFVGGVFDAQTPMLNLYLMPFFFPTQDDLMKVSHSALGDKIRASAEKEGIKMLAVGDGGSRQITNNVRPIKSPADMKGLKLRTPPIESIIEAMKALGANPVSIPYGDTYMAQDQRRRRAGEPARQHRRHEVLRSAEVHDDDRLPVPPRADRHGPRHGTHCLRICRRSSRMARGFTPMSRTGFAVSSTTTTTT